VTGPDPQNAGAIHSDIVHNSCGIEQIANDEFQRRPSVALHATYCRVANVVEVRYVSKVFNVLW
jgi:hypothetical protein